MAVEYPQGRGAEAGRFHTFQIREFNKLYKSSIAEDDANGVLLNEAVTMHLSEAKLPNAAADDPDDEQGISALLRQKLELLEESRKKFMKHLNDEQKQSVLSSANTTQAVLSLVDSARFDWCRRSESGSATATMLKRKFHQVCKSLDQNAALFSMLPKESHYVSVFYGAFNSIVAASVMHQAMATGLPKIVDELNAIITDVANKFEIYPDAKRQMKRIVIELYTRIFDLLAQIMKWYSKNNHAWKTMKKDCYNDFAHALQDIRNWVDLVNKGAWNNFVLELRSANDEHRDTQETRDRAQDHFREDMRRIAEKYAEAQDNAALQQAAQQAQLEHLSSPAFQQSLADVMMSKFFQRFDEMGASQVHTLVSMAGSMSSDTASMAVPRMIGGPSNIDIVGVQSNQYLPAVAFDPVHATFGSPDRSPLHSVSLKTRGDVELHSRNLNDWFTEGHVHPVHLSHSSPSRSALHESIASRLLQWNKATESSVLCIQLPFDPARGSVGSRIASYMVSTACEVGYPIISYFCALPRQDNVEEGRTPHTIALCGMMACLIRQLVELLPDTVPESSSIVIDDARFKALDGTLKTWNKMLSLFADLLSLIPRSMLIVIHGMQRLNSGDTTDQIQALLDVLRNQICERRPQTVKILFVTEGQSRALVPWLRRGEHAIYDGDRRPGRQLNAA